MKSKMEGRKNQAFAGVSGFGHMRACARLPRSFGSDQREFERPVSVERAREVLATAPGPRASR